VLPLEQHTAIMATRLLEQFKGKSGWATLLGIVGDRYQDLEAEIQLALTAYDPRTAVGAQLDVVGRVVSESRGGRTDTAYRARILGKIAALNSNGSIPDLLKVAGLLSSDASLELYPGRVRAILDGASSAESAEAFKDIFCLAAAAGIGCAIVYTTGAGYVFAASNGSTLEDYTTGAAFGGDGYARIVVRDYSGFPESGQIVVAPGTSDEEIATVITKDLDTGNFPGTSGNVLILTADLTSTPDADCEVAPLEVNDRSFGGGYWGSEV